MAIKDLILVSATCITVGLAIMKYVLDFNSSNRDSLKKFITAIKAELGIIGAWARPYPDSSIEDYKKRKDFDSFWSPTRIIFEFDYPVLKNLLTSNYISLLGQETISSCAELLQTVNNFYQFNKEYRKFVFTKPDFLAEFSSIDLNNKFIEKLDKDQQSYLKKVYAYNYVLHHDLIGNSDTQKGLFYYYQSVSEQLINYQIKTKWWIWPLLFIASLFLVIGISFLIQFILSIIGNGFI